MKSTILVAMMLAASVLPVYGAADEQQEQLQHVVLTEDGLELVGHSVPTGANQVECEGQAPQTTDCTTGLHVADEVWAVSVGAGFSYTGTTEVRLFHAMNVLVMQVHWIDGDFAGGDIYGTFPTSPAVFWHECYSYELGTNGDDPMPLPGLPNGEPGGQGIWRCFVLYP